MCALNLLINPKMSFKMKFVSNVGWC